MDHSATFARHIARLVWLLLREPSNVDEQKAILRALALASKEGPAELVADDGVLTANGVTVSGAFAGVDELVGQLTAHGVRGLSVDAGAAPGALLGIARLVAGPAAGRDGGAAIAQQHAALATTGVRLVLRPAPGTLPELELLEDTGAPVAPRRPRLSSADVAPRPSGSTGGLFGLPEDRTPSGSAASLLAELANPATTIQRVDHIVEYLIPMAEQAVRDVKPNLLQEILHGILRRETVATDPEERRVLAVGLRKTFKPHVLRTIATQLPRAADQRDELMALLARAGEDGADALVEQIASVTHALDRRVYFDALLQLQAGVPHLVHMLGDTRWFVARNAADLLGEMQAKEAEQPLTWLLQHGDERVRHSATTALMRLGTPRATQAIQDALKDGVPQMRKEAASVLATRKDPRTVALVLRALDVEKDEDVQVAFLVALGRIGLPEAVQRLVAAAEAEKGWIKKKPASLRIGAIQGLAEARTPEATAALTALTSDKDAEVSAAATFALARVARKEG